MTNSWNTPVEAFEHEYPVRVRAYRIRGGSGGAGEYAGGDGIVRELEFLEPAEVTILSDRRVRGPWGLAGGAAGAGGMASVIGRDAVRELPAKTHFEIQRGERMHIETPGGGGWGASDISGKMSDR
jgi:N-methylhydantoinase B